MIFLPYINSKIQTLLGQCYLESGSLFEAEEVLATALHSLGYSFPKMEFLIDIKTITQLIQLRWKLSCLGEFKLRDDYIMAEDSLAQAADYTEQLASCLTQMFDLFRVIDSYKRTSSFMLEQM